MTTSHSAPSQKIKIKTPDMGPGTNKKYNGGNLEKTMEKLVYGMFHW